MTDPKEPDSTQVASPAPPRPSAAKQAEEKGPLPKGVKGRKPPTPPQIRLVNLLVLVFMGYAIFNYLGSGASAPEDQARLEPKNDIRAAVHSDDPRIERLLTQDAFNTIGKVFPTLRAGVGSTTLQAGQGRGIFCGQTVTYRDESGAEKKITLGRAHDHESEGVVWGLEGARIGEIRELQIPKDFTTSPFSNNKPEMLRKVVEIVAATPELPKAGEFPLKRFIQRGGAGYDLRCGDQAVAHMTLWDSDGKLLFSSLGGLPVYFEMGVGKGVPYGIELAASEMGPTGEYTAVIPPELVAPLHPGIAPPSPPDALEVQPFPASVALPAKGVLIVDLSFPKDLPLKQQKAVLK